MSTAEIWTQYEAIDLLRQLIRDNPQAERYQLLLMLQTALRKDWRYMPAIVEFWFSWHYPRVVNPLRANQRLERNNYDDPEEVGRVAKKLQNKLMDLMLPTGKSLRDSTFRECRQVGGFFSRVAKLGKPNEIVGEKLTEGQLVKALKIGK